MHLITRLSQIGKSYRNPILISALVVAIIPFSVFAQSVTTEDEDEKEKVESTVEEVVVSASRVPVPAEHVGSSVTVFNKEDIEKRQATHVHELLRESPGLAVSQQSFSGQTQLRIRGSEGNHSLVLFDGIELSDPVSSDEFYLQHLPVFATDRIEVLRGPQSSLYGSEAIGGVINITSPIPEEGTTARLSMTQGSLSTTKLNSYVAFASGEHFGSVAMSHIKSKGISAKSDNAEADGLRQTSAHLKFGTQISESLDISATTLLVNNDSDYDECGYFDSVTSVFYPSNNCRGDDKKRAVGIELNYEQLGGDLIHKVKLFHTRHKRYDYAYFSDSSNNTISSKLGKKSKIEYQAVVNWEAIDTDQTTIFALNKENNEAKGQYVAGGDGGKFDTKSFVLEQRMDFGNNIFTSLSGRYDDNKDKQFKDYKTYRGTLAWVVNDDLRLHSSAGTGVKNPQVSELYGWSSDWVANPDLKPETSKSWDLGFEFHTGVSDLTVDLTYFTNIVTNLIGSDCGRDCGDETTDLIDNDGDGETDEADENKPDVQKSVNEPGESTIKGWELSILGNLADRYDVSASATFLRGFGADGKELVRRPSQILSLNINRQSNFFGNPGSINLNIQHVGNQLDITTWPNVADLPKYTLVNLGAKLNLNSNLELTGKIDNLFGQKYSEVRGYNKPGRTINLGLRYTF